MIKIKKNKILITGSNGFIGKNIFDYFSSRKLEVYGLTKKNCDLTNYRKVNSYFRKIKPKYVVHCAAKSGGLKYNLENPAVIFSENLIILRNVLLNCSKFSIKKLILICNSCMYPEKIKRKFKESDIFKGPPDPTSEATAFSKLAYLVGSRTFKKQFQLNSTCIVLPNVYGPKDNFSLDNSHFVGALIRKIATAKGKNLNSVKFWGTGHEIRDVIYVDDIAESIIRILKNNINSEILNISSGNGYKIKEYVNIIKKILNYNGKVKWKKKLSGADKKILDNKELKRKLKWLPKTNLTAGLSKTINWYLENNL